MLSHFSVTKSLLDIVSRKHQKHHSMDGAPMQTPERCSTIQSQLKQLEEVISKALADGEDSNLLLPFIKRTLHQFHLASKYHEKEILIECYMRTRKRIEAGEEILNLIPWLKKVVYNIVREKHRYLERQRSVQKSLIRNSYPDLGICHDALNAEDLDYVNLQSLSKSTAAISAEELEILTLHIVEGLSWNQICEFINARGNLPKVSVPTLRKRGERALKRLRQTFFSHLLSGGEAND